MNWVNRGRLKNRFLQRKIIESTLLSKLRLYLIFQGLYILIETFLHGLQYSLIPLFLSLLSLEIIIC